MLDNTKRLQLENINHIGKLPSLLYRYSEKS